MHRNALFGIASRLQSSNCKQCTPMKPKLSLNRKLRACMGCGMLKTSALFRSEGCDNCPSLCLKGSARNVLECTSDSFKGLVHISNSKSSWVAKWLRISGCKNGLYALTISGELPEYFVEDLRKEGKAYIPRNKPFSL